MKRLKLILVIISLLAHCATIVALCLLLAGCRQVNGLNGYGTGHDDSNTVNALPVAGTSSFASSTILFLKQEDANRWLEQKFPNFVSSGCLGITSPGLILTPTACIAYNAGFRSTETGAITLNDNSSTWVAMDENTSGSNAGLPNFTRAGSTHYLLDTLDVSQPTMPNDAQLIARVTTLGGAITAIDQSMKKTTPQTAGPAGAVGPAGSTGLTGATGAAGPAGPAPTGNIPQIVGYSGANVVEAETVSGAAGGDCTTVAFTRTGLNAYSLSVTGCTKTAGTAFGALATLGVGTSLSSGGGNLNLNMPATSCTNQFVTALTATGTGTCTTDTLASAQHANQGTTTTLLHGNGAGNPAFSAVSLTADVIGVLPLANMTPSVVSVTEPAPFTVSGTYTPHAGMLFAFVRCDGGGGAGGGAVGTAGTVNSGSGGGSGSYSEIMVTAAQVTADGGTETVTVGLGGTAGTAGNHPGNNAGDTSFGTRCIGKGGTGGNAGNALGQVAGGPGGVAGTGTVTSVGNDGQNNVVSSSIVMVPTIPLGGAGPWGGQVNASTGVGAGGCFTGGTAKGFGTGGEGSICYNANASGAGSQGAPGVVIVTEYNSQ